MNEHSLEQHTREKHLHTFQPQKRVDAEPQTEAQAERTIDQYPITPLMMEPTAKAVRKNSTVAIYEGGHGVKATGGVDATVEAPHPKQAKAKILVDPVSGEAPRSKKQDEAKVLADTISGMNATGEAFHAKMQVEAKVFANPVAGVDATAKVQKQGKGNVIATLNPAASEFEPGKMIKAIGKVHSARAVADTPMVGTDNSDQLHQQILHSPPGQGNNLQPGVSAEDIMPSNLVGQLPQSLERKESPASKSVDSGVEFGDIQMIISVPEKEDGSNPAKRHNIGPLPQSTRAERAASSVASATSRQGIMARIASFVAGSAVKVVEPGAEVESDDQSMELVPANTSPQVDIFAEVKAVSGTPWTSITYLGNKWSVIPVDHRQIHLKILRELCHSPGELLRCNFTLEPYKDEIIKFMQKCYTCRRKYSITQNVKL
jgi:hypothetical protein